MSRVGARLVLGLGAVLAAACSGADGSGIPAIPDGATVDGGGAGGRSAGTGGRNGGNGGTGGRGTGGSSTGGTSDSGLGGASTGGRDAATNTGGASGDSGARDGSDASLNPDGSQSDSGSDGAPEAAAPGCPSNGNYSFTFSGSGCGDLDNTAPDWRFDGFNCRGRFEYDNGGGKGVTGSAVTFGWDGGLIPASPLSIGSATMTCTGLATATTVSLDCVGDAGTCSIQLTKIP